MESDDNSSRSSFESNSVFNLREMSAENQRQIDAANSLINDSAMQAIVDKFSLENFAKNHPVTDEIENGVRELIRENIKLKETLKSNNSSMKRHFTILENLLENEETNHKNYKSKLDEAKDVIGKLRNENSELKKPIQEIARTIESKFMNEKTKLLQENQVYRERWAAMQQKLLKFEQMTALFKVEKEQDYQTIANLQRQFDSAERARRKLSLEVDRFKGQEMKLQQILSSDDSRNVTNVCFWNAVFPSPTVSSSRENQLMDSFREYDKLLQLEDVTFSDSSQNVASSSEIRTDCGIDNEEKSIEQLKEEISTLRKQILREETICALCKKRLEAARSKFQALHQLAITVLKEFSSKIKALEISLVKAKDDSKDITSLIHELSDKQNRITQLESELEIALNKAENCSLLQSQIKVYEEDYNSERAARESLANDKQKLEQNLHLVTQENTKLKKQLRATSTGDSNFLTISENENSSLFTCFNEKCNETFASEEDLQTHVYFCFGIKD